MGFLLSYDLIVFKNLATMNVQALLSVPVHANQYPVAQWVLHLMEQHGALASIQAIDSIEGAQYKSSTVQNCCVLQAWNKSTLCHIQGTQRLSCCAYVDCTSFIFCSGLFCSPFFSMSLVSV